VEAQATIGHHEDVPRIGIGVEKPKDKKLLQIEVDENLGKNGGLIGD
jgi:hypothetical protein